MCWPTHCFPFPSCACSNYGNLGLPFNGMLCHKQPTHSLQICGNSQWWLILGAEMDGIPRSTIDPLDLDTKQQVHTWLSTHACHGWRNRSSRPGDRWTNVCCMAPEKLADVQIISCFQGGCLKSLDWNRLWNFCVNQTGLLLLSFSTLPGLRKDCR